MSVDPPTTSSIENRRPDLSLTEAAEQLGVHYMTAYRYVRLGHLEATKVGAEWRISAANLERYIANGASPTKPVANVDFDKARAQLTTALIDGDEAEAWNIVEPILENSPDTTHVHTRLLGPVLTNIGDAWAAGDLTIAAEHRATAVARRVIGRSRPWFRGPGRRRGLVVVGAPEIDTHALPTALFADLVRAKGPDVIDLGSQTPAATFADVAQTTTGDGLVIVIVVTLPAAQPDAQRSAAAIRGVDSATPILIGGYGVPNEQTATTLGATHWAETNDEAATLAASLLAAPR